MAVQTRRPVDDDFIGPGPYLAMVTNHLDPTYMGGLEVTLIRAIPGRSTTRTSNVIVKYCSPFFGVTPQSHEGNNSSNFNDVQKSYGMWMVPPDIGCTVMVFFVEGDINQGYWFGCVPDMYQNHMVPGIAASQYSAMTEEQLRQYGTRNVPVAEFSKNTRNSNGNTSSSNPDRYTKPVHPFADRLVQQGLLIDNIRGITSSSARREVPSRVFGISTPGPVDTNAPLKPAGFSTGGGQGVMMPTSRLGGHQLVMDDGDAEGKNELFRIRTRTGHQILLHNSSDLVYIANSKGTAWIELTSAGKIDVYAEDSVSIRTKGDFNLHADRDFNLEAVRNFNIATTEGDLNFNIRKKINVIGDEFFGFISGNFNLTVAEDANIGVGSNFNLGVASNGRITVGGNAGIAAGATMAISGGDNVSISSAAILQSAGRIDLNGALANAPEIADSAEVPVPLNLYSVPQRDAGAGWADNNFYKSTSLVSIMQRVPTHEPWDQHENINPDQFSLANTGSDLRGASTGEDGQPIEGDATANTPYPATAGPASDRGRVQDRPFAWSTDRPFIDKVKQVSTALRFPPIDLLAMMSLESARTFDPWIRNNLGYTGLIQFGTPAARELGTTTDTLRRMSRVQQMEYVERYFRHWGWPNSRCPNPTLANLYLTVLLPACRFAGPNDRIAVSGDSRTGGWYRSNRGFDPQRRGYFTPAMVEQAVMVHKREVQQILSRAGVTL
jgi:hypothetical protein